MDALTAAAGLLCAAALSPGPNNLIVLDKASHRGVRGTAPEIAGIVVGGLALLATVALGAGMLFAAWPASRRWLGIAGALYLAWLGVVRLIDSLRDRTTDAPVSGGRSAGVLGLAGFQFLNPKSWVIVLTLLAATPSTDLRGYLPLAGLFVLIPTVCLLLWAGLGALLARWLVRPSIRRGIDAGMGALLLVSAGLLLLEP